MFDEANRRSVKRMIGQMVESMRLSRDGSRDKVMTIILYFEDICLFCNNNCLPMTRSSRWGDNQKTATGERPNP